ncbi:helix-turn-helix transcriptional regulator [Elizabethkingia meningoseptica]|uniref:helix-turn-helix transcriptional regulator n=1 Tax=Elizabethkingia meningoseptica TaxID=238 RepID=UPI0038928454
MRNEDHNKKSKTCLLVGTLIILATSINVYIYQKIKNIKIPKAVPPDKDIKPKEKDKISKEKLKEIIELAKKNDSTFLMKFQEAYPEFICKLLEINPKLDNLDLAFCALVKLNFSAKEIAAYTFIQHASVQQRKRRMRKKLNIPSEIDLYMFFNDL